MTLDVFQTVFTLAANASLVNELKGSQMALQRTLEVGLTSNFPGDGWELVWGPVVWKHQNPEDSTTGPHNSWYVAYHPRLEFEDGSVHPTYVIAIAGTPMAAAHVWLTQNLAVTTVINFDDWVENKFQESPREVRAKDVKPDIPYIAKGTAETVHFLLTTRAPDCAKSTGITLLEFITKSNKSPSSRFITTGHSLGGALCSSLALSLVSAGITAAESTLSYPIAAPSPGDIAFRERFIKKLPARRKEGARSYQVWNVNLVNMRDPIPQAWCTDKELFPKQNLHNIPNLFDGLDEWIVAALVGQLVGPSRDSGVKYAPLPSQDIPSLPKDGGNLLSAVLRQHIQAYADAVGVSFPPTPKSLEPGVCEKGAGEKLCCFPVVDTLEWTLEHPEEAKKGVRELEAATEA